MLKQQEAVARLLVGLYDLALDLGWRWDGERRGKRSVFRYCAWGWGRLWFRFHNPPTWAAAMSQSHAECRSEF